LTTPQAWSVVARNLPEHAGNAIHTDAGARAAGFPRALVAGVTTYAYLTHPIVAGWGLEWVARGGGEVRFRSPVFEHDEVRCIPTSDTDGSGAVTVEAQCQPGNEPQARAILRAVPKGAQLRDLRAGEVLEPLVVELTGEWSADYGSRAGDDLSLYADHGIVHPAVWPALANRVMSRSLVRGAWIHTRSIVAHHDVAPVGATALLESVVVRRFQRHGERAVIDVRISVHGTPVATLEHEAIVALPARDS
jgi:acyl dehydratase